MNKKITKIFQYILLLMCLFANAVVLGDEGTDDTDFDYLPPDDIGIFSRFTEFIGGMFATPSHSGSYTTAKRRLYRKIGDKNTFYCGCPTNLSERTFDEVACGYEPRINNNRAHRLEAEHVLPAYWISAFHSDSTCWEADPSCGDARDCCLKKDERFKKAHNDLVNLIPTIGELNADRNNYLYDLVDGEIRDYGDCDYEINASERHMEPHRDIRGDVSRIYFYMRDTYDLEFPDEITERLKEWDEVDPISNSEKERNLRIKNTQGTANQLLE